eukprot:6204372-Pleurochrysis_carterae.AAC.2
MLHRRKTHRFCRDGANIRTVNIGMLERLTISSAARAVELQGNVSTIDSGVKLCGVPEHTSPLLLNDVMFG